MKLQSFCKDAGELYIIAVRIAGFDAIEVMREICLIQRTYNRKIAIPTLERALQRIRERSLTFNEKLQRKKALQNIM